MWLDSIHFKNCSQPTEILHNKGHMSTAIVSAYLSDGFVIGADGRRKDPNLGVADSDIVQKIFSIKLAKLRLVYAWAGSIHNLRVDGTIFDFKDATDLILQAIDMNQVYTFPDFVALFANLLYVLTLKYLGRGVGVFDDGLIAKALFLAYFEGQPYKAGIYANHDSHIVLRPVIKCAPALAQFCVFNGSKKAYELLNPPLATVSLLEVSNLVRDYIRLCFTHRDTPIKGENPIGGHIHIGHLTPERFSWIDPPIVV
jgi:hypothetical protein